MQLRAAGPNKREHNFNPYGSFPEMGKKVPIILGNSHMEITKGTLYFFCNPYIFQSLLWAPLFLESPMLRPMVPPLIWVLGLRVQLQVQGCRNWLRGVRLV